MVATNSPDSISGIIGGLGLTIHSPFREIQEAQEGKEGLDFFLHHDVTDVLLKIKRLLQEHVKGKDINYSAIIAGGVVDRFIPWGSEAKNFWESVAL